MKTQDSIDKILLSLGLSPKEITIYVAMLGTGTAPASTLAKRTGIGRSMAQYVCQQLEKKKLVTMSRKRNSYLFSPEPPEKLLYLLENEKHAIEKKERDVERIIGELHRRMNPHSVLPKVQFFEGPDAVVEGYKRVLKAVPEESEICSYLHLLTEAEDRFGMVEDLAKITEGFERKKIYNRFLSPDSESARAWKKHDKAGVQQTRILPASKDQNPIDMIIYGNSIYSVAAEGDQIFGYIAQNKSLVQMQKHLFELLWKTAKK